MKFARWVFAIAGVYGLMVIVPMYFLEARFARPNTTLPHSEFYYGFVGVVLAWQIAFLMISRQPRRHRTIMLAAMVEKFSYVGAVAMLLAQRRVDQVTVAAAAIDFILGVSFVFAYLETSRAERQPVLLPDNSAPTEGAGPLI